MKNQVESCMTNLFLFETMFADCVFVLINSVVLNLYLLGSRSCIDLFPRGVTVNFCLIAWRCGVTAV